MDEQSLPTRFLAAGLPIVIVALVFGAIGYATTAPSPHAIPTLPEARLLSPSAQGEVASIGGELQLINEDGVAHTYTLDPAATIEVLRPIGVDELRIGDWLNGGAVPHPDTVLALINLILLPQPVTP